MEISNMFKLAGNLTTALLFSADFAYYWQDSLKTFAKFEFQQDLTHKTNAYSLSLGFSCNPLSTDWKNLF